MKACPIALCILFAAWAPPTGAQDNRIAYNGQQLFLSGANLAWLNFARDIGPGNTDFERFADIMLHMHDHGGNALRWWLHTNGTHTPEFDASGLVSRPGQGTIEDLRTVLDLAWEREIGLILCLWSFDMLRKQNDPEVLNRNTLLLTDTTYTRAYIDNCLTPMVDSLKGHPAIIAWEIFNEPEGMSEEFGWSFNQHVPMAAIQRFVNRCAGAIHRTDPEARVTSGAWSFIVLTDVATKPNRIGPDLSRLTQAEKERLETRFLQKYGASLKAEEIVRHVQEAASKANFNYYADSRLIAEGGDAQGTLDFYSVHYYDWAGTALSPFHHPASRWQLDKPVVVAEFDMQDTFGVPEQELFEKLYRNGYAGALPWSWTDNNFSTPEQMLTAMQYMWDHYREDVDVLGIAGDWPVVTLTSPEDDAAFAEGSAITLVAEAQDNDGEVVLVEFFASDTLKIGEVDSEPYIITWSNAPPGVYRLTAVATDDLGHQRTSNRVQITVGSPAILRLEAEEAELQGSLTVMSDANASNGAYVTMQQTGTITWNLSGVAADGNYEIVFMYMLSFDTPKYQYINVNGVRVAEVAFDGEMNVWLEKWLSVDLLQGDNVIEMELSWGWMNVDYLGVPRDILTSIAETPDRIPHFSLQQNYPNPFNPTTTIRYSLGTSAHVKLTVYDLLGRQVQVLVDEPQSAGNYTLPFDGRRLASGLYFYRLSAGAFVDEKRMMLLK